MFSKKRISIFRLILLMSLMIFSLSTVTAHDFQIRDVEHTATSNAKRDANTCIYALAGCGLPIFSLFYVEYAPAADIPASELLGKSPEYVQVYTRAYQQEIHKKRRRAVLSGSLASIGLALGVLVLFVTGE